MADETRKKLLIEAYKQSFASKHHYDNLSWTIAGGTLVFVGFITKTILGINFNDYIHTIIIRSTLGLLSIAVIVLWYKIYERNRFWGEVANETARDIEREYEICGLGIAFMKGALDRKVLLKNTDEKGLHYNNYEPYSQECKSDSMHKALVAIKWCLIILTVISVFLPTKPNNTLQKESPSASGCTAPH